MSGWTPAFPAQGRAQAPSATSVSPLAVATVFPLTAELATGAVADQLAVATVAPLTVEPATVAVADQLA
eukprot:10019176-Alexandrium_andersonii.AAC.1